MHPLSGSNAAETDYRTSLHIALKRRKDPEAVQRILNDRLAAYHAVPRIRARESPSGG